MAGTVKQVGSRTYRESFGRYYEDFQVGDVYQHRPGRTVTQYDNISFTLLTMNTHPLHFDEEYAKHSEFGRCIVCSPLTVALMVGMSVSDVSQKAIANLGWTDIRLTHPLYAGDTLYSQSEVLDLVRSLKGSRWQLFTKIQLPGALPYIFSGMKVGAILAVAGAVVGEFLGSDRGLGYLMLQVQVTLDTPAMFMAVILITLLGMLLYGIVLLLERWLVPRDARVA